VAPLLVDLMIEAGITVTGVAAIFMQRAPKHANRRRWIIVVTACALLLAATLRSVAEGRAIAGTYFVLLLVFAAFGNRIIDAMTHTRKL
jgi:uncharacterized membrane protein YdfJ with MMPL/SSD domain